MMKYCEDYAALLDLFVDGELPPDEMERVGAHLEGCPGCRAYVDDALAIRAGFPDIEDTAVPEGFAESVMERVRAEAGKSVKAAEPQRLAVRRWTRTLAALAACCALVMLVGTSGRWGSDSAMMRAGDMNGEMEMAAACPAEASAGGTDCAADDAAESGIAAQAAPEAKAAVTAADKEQEQTEIRMTRGAEEPSEAYDDVSREEDAPQAAAAPSLAEAAPEEGLSAAFDEGTVLRVTAEEAGNLLDGVVPVWENAGERCYELNGEEYQALLEALGRPVELFQTENTVFSVLVEMNAG